MNFLGRLMRRSRIYFERDHEILGRTIRLPAFHMLDWIRLHHQRYDMPLADVSEQVVRKYSAACMIDIGANVGDTAAFMARSNDVSILCIEGNPDYLRLLRKNLPTISKTSEIVSAYVGPEDGMMTGHIVANKGSARIVEGDGYVPTRSLSSIVEESPRFREARLVKIDTDGQDARIVSSSADVLAKMKPVVFFEYLEERGGVASECREMLHTLANIGYSNFHLFDNFGHHILRISAQQLDQMMSLTAYLRAARRDMRPTLHYYDVCAFHANDADLSDKLLRRYEWDS